MIYYFLPEYIFVIYIYLEQYFIWDFRFIGMTLCLLFLMNHMDLKLYFFWLSWCFYLFLIFLDQIWKKIYSFIGLQKAFSFLFAENK